MRAKEFLLEHTKTDVQSLLQQVKDENDPIFVKIYNLLSRSGIQGISSDAQGIDKIELMVGSTKQNNSILHSTTVRARLKEYLEDLYKNGFDVFSYLEELVQPVEKKSRKISKTVYTPKKYNFIDVIAATTPTDAPQSIDTLFISRGPSIDQVIRKVFDHFFHVTTGKSDSGPGEVSLLLSSQEISKSQSTNNSMRGDLVINDKRVEVKGPWGRLGSHVGFTQKNMAEALRGINIKRASKAEWAAAKKAEDIPQDNQIAEPVGANQSITPTLHPQGDNVSVMEAQSTYLSSISVEFIAYKMGGEDFDYKKFISAACEDWGFQKYKQELINNIGRRREFLNSWLNAVFERYQKQENFDGILVICKNSFQYFVNSKQLQGYIHNWGTIYDPKATQLRSLAPQVYLK